MVAAELNIRPSSSSRGRSRSSQSRRTDGQTNGRQSAPFEMNRNVAIVVVTVRQFRVRVVMVLLIHFRRLFQSSRRL
jgi:hypothetical protein